MHREKRDLECSIKEFERALNICPLDHPCRATGQSSLALVKFILCQVEGMDVSFEVPFGLYRNRTCFPSCWLRWPALHINSAGRGHSAPFEKQRVEVQIARASAFLHEATELSSVDSRQNRTAQNV